MGHRNLPAAGDEHRWYRIALWLVLGTLAYNLIEAAVALWSGLDAGSIALLGFGLDSVIESVAAGALLWRLWVGAKETSGKRLAELDGFVTRLVGVTFLVLAAYILFQVSWTFATHVQPEESTVGTALAIASVIVMPLVSWGKIRAAHRLESQALLAEAKETLACSYLSLTLLLGLLLNASLGWWWADPVAALLMVPWIAKEGLEGVRGEVCGCE